MNKLHYIVYYYIPNVPLMIHLFIILLLLLLLLLLLFLLKEKIRLLQRAHCP